MTPEQGTLELASSDHISGFCSVWWVGSVAKNSLVFFGAQLEISMQPSVESRVSKVHDFTCRLLLVHGWSFLWMLVSGVQRDSHPAPSVMSNSSSSRSQSFRLGTL